ncbi:MAG TPA: hypothetical protein VFX79_01465 [Candidatus Saccharimonadales bacterium]|nr:hypothetical protein [Candidatus Saccharimonadales bacterium]
MTPQPPKPQGPTGPEHEPRPGGEGPEVSAEDQRWMDDLNAGRDPDAPEPSEERAAERPEDDEPSVVSELEGEQPDAAATGGEEPKPADDDDTAERPVVGGGDDDDKEPPKRGWFGRVKDRISDAYYKAGAVASSGGGERGEKARKASKYLPIGIAAVGSAGIMFGGLSLLDGGESQHFDFSGSDIDLDKHLSIDGADSTKSIDVTHDTTALDGSGTGGSAGTGEDSSGTGGLSPDSTTTPAEQSNQQALDHFQVEAGNGDSHEIQDYAKKHGIDVDGQKAYEIYEKLHNKFPDQDIINLLDHSGSDSYNHTLADGSTEQRISAPSENATFGSQEMQDLVDKELGLSSEQAAPSGPSDGGTSASETATVSYDSDSDSATAAAQGDTLEETTGKDVQKDNTSTFDDRNVSYSHEGPSVSGGEKLVASAMAGAAGGMGAHFIMNRDKSGNNSGNGSTTGENGNNGNDKKNEESNSPLEERIAALEQALLQQKEVYENHIKELTEVIKQLEAKLEQKAQDDEEAERRQKSEKTAEKVEKKAKKKVKKHKRKTKEAKKKARKQKTRRKVTEATLNAERKAHSDAQLAEARARTTEEMRAAAESAKTRADLLTKA